MKKIKDGSTVYLRGQRQSMTVVLSRDTIEGIEYKCFWIDKNGHAQERWFNDILISKKPPITVRNITNLW